jgi:hypothetical protein
MWEIGVVAMWSGAGNEWGHSKVCNATFDLHLGLRKHSTTSYEGTTSGNGLVLTATLHRAARASQSQGTGKTGLCAPYTSWIL